MNKYNIEGGLDFFSELYKSLDNDLSYDDNNRCLITDELLTDKYVTLKCGHKFNYIPLYHDLVNHKKKFNHMEGIFTKLNTNEIRCPYCREKQEFLLTYYEDLGLQKVNGVNFYDPNNKETIYNSYCNSPKCEYLIPNPNYDALKEESSTNNKYLSEKCNMFGSKINIYNHKDPASPITYGDTKHYCYSHKKIMIKQYKLKQKEAETLAKKHAKEMEKQAKLDAKAKEKEEKQNAKKAKQALKQVNKNVLTENLVIGPSNVENPMGCSQILKTGPNKGNPCGCKIFTNNFCKRHLPH
jgi:hypothetical protein